MVSDDLVLRAVRDLAPNAYGVPLQRQLVAWGFDVSFGELYRSLDRLERQGYVRSHLADATPERGGRPKAFYVPVEGEQA